MRPSDRLRETAADAAAPTVLMTVQRRHPRFRSTDVQGAPRMSRLANALAFATLVACGSDSTSPQIEALEGSYSLKTVNGQPLPVTLQGDGFTIKLNSDVMTFTANGTWSEAFAFQRTVGTTITNETDSDAGTWTRIGNTI